MVKNGDGTPSSFTRRIMNISNLERVTMKNHLRKVLEKRGVTGILSTTLLTVNRVKPSFVNSKRVSFR